MNIRRWHALAAFAPIALGSLSGVAHAANGNNVKVVYHVNEGFEQATNAVRNIRNHLSADPSVKITVVTHAAGIDFLLDGAQDKNGNPYDAAVQELVGKGVDFRVCEITLVSRKIDRRKVIPEATIVPSGVAEVARLQAREQYVYLRP